MLFRRSSFLNSYKNLVFLKGQFFSSSPVLELIDEHYDKKMIAKMFELHENIKKESNINLVEISERPDQTLFAPLKGIVEGFTDKFQKSFILISNILIDSFKNRKTRDQTSL